MAPDRISVPPLRVSPPVPVIAPLKVPSALLSARLLAPRMTVPLPDSDAALMLPAAAEESYKPPTCVTRPASLTAPTPHRPHPPPCVLPLPPRRLT